MKLARTAFGLLGFSCLLVVAAQGAAASMIVDLDAQIHHRNSTVNNEVVITLGPGDYRVDAFAGTFTAWRGSSAQLWRAQYAVDIGNDQSFETFLSVTDFATPELALAAATPLFFSLTSMTDVAFFLGFDESLSDNEGGMSLRVSNAVPEPSAALVFMVGLAIAGNAVRRSRIS